jgi:D-hydroxyproline dehydrogenase subunit beta
MGVVVVGGGVIGASCAYALARNGIRVTLIERSELAAGASGRNHGLLLHPTDPVLVPLARATFALYDELAAVAPLPLRLDPEPIGFLLVAGERASERAAGRAQAEDAATCGVPVRPLDADDLRDVEPDLAPDLVEGWLLEDARRLDPAALTVSLALLAAEAGADVRRHTTVRALLSRGDRVRGVATDRGQIEADAVVIAAGPGSGALLRGAGVILPTAAARGWLVHLGPGRGGPRRLVERAGWHPLPEEEAVPPLRADALAGGGAGADVGTIVHPAVDGTFLAGGSRQHAAEPGDGTVPARIARGAVDLFPGLAGAPVLASWWGVRPMSPDGRPLIGGVREGLIVATGHGSQGVILGGASGSLVASILLGEAPEIDPAPFDPRRFR